MRGQGMSARVAVAVLPLLLSACAGTTVLEQRHVMRYRCESNALEITLSGTSSASALKVARVSKVRDGKDLIVNVRIGLVTLGDSGDFVEKIRIRPGLSRVLFGQERMVVWSRENGCAAMP